MGRLLQSPLRRTTQAARLPRPLHAPRRHLQLPPALYRGWPRPLSLSRQGQRRPPGDRYLARREVHASLLAARSTRRLHAHPTLRHPEQLHQTTLARTLSQPAAGTTGSSQIQENHRAVDPAALRHRHNPMSAMRSPATGTDRTAPTPAVIEPCAVPTLRAWSTAAASSKLMKTPLLLHVYLPCPATGNSSPTRCAIIATKQGRTTTLRFEIHRPTCLRRQSTPKSAEFRPMPLVQEVCCLHAAHYHQITNPHRPPATPAPRFSSTRFIRHGQRGAT